MWRAKNDPTNSQGKKCFELRISSYSEEKISVDREECYMFMKPCFQFIIRFCTVKLAKLKKSEREIVETIGWNVKCVNEKFMNWDCRSERTQKKNPCEFVSCATFSANVFNHSLSCTGKRFYKECGGSLIQSASDARFHSIWRTSEKNGSSLIILLVDNKMRIRAAPAADAKVVASNIDGGERVEW